MAEHADQTRAGSQLPGLLVPGLVPPLLGVLAFALLRESYTWFYGRYGVVPEDVGVSQIRMLTGVLRMFHLWSLPIPGRPASGFLIVLIGIWAYFVVGRWLLRRLRSRSPRAEESIVLRYPLLVGCSVLMLLVVLVVLVSAWVVPRDRDFAGKRLQLRQGVRPGQLSMLAIQADPVQVIWTAGSPEPRGLVESRLVYLGHANGVMVPYDPPKWGTCEVDSCPGVVWRVSESDAVIQVEVNPPDAHAPSISDPYPS
jgi:hypothetical protein